MKNYLCCWNERARKEAQNVTRSSHGTMAAKLLSSGLSTMRGSTGFRLEKKRHNDKRSAATSPPPPPHPRQDNVRQVESGQFWPCVVISYGTQRILLRSRLALVLSNALKTNRGKKKRRRIKARRTWVVVSTASRTNQKSSNLLSIIPLLCMSQSSPICFHTGVRVLPDDEHTTGRNTRPKHDKRIREERNQHTQKTKPPK